MPSMPFVITGEWITAYVRSLWKEGKWREAKIALRGTFEFITPQEISDVCNERKKFVGRSDVQLDLVPDEKGERP